jgi:Glycosyltransferase family 87
MKTNPLRIAAAVCLAAVGVSILVFIARTNNASQRDFISYWAAGQQLVHGANPYDGDAVLRIESAVGFDRVEPLIMRNPPLAFLLAWPLGFVGSNVGIVLWFIVLLFSLVASIHMLWTLHGRPDNRLHLLGYCFAPVMGCLMLGQFGLFLLFGVVLFLFFHKSRPFLAGAALLLCAMKPHLFLPFGVALAAWGLSSKAYHILAGACAALLACCAVAFCIDRQGWSQYSLMMSHTGVKNVALFTLSKYFRLLVDRDAFWLQFLPQAAACVWTLWYFLTRRARWNWMDQGLVVLLVSVMCAPYAWFTDEAVLLPAVLVGVYRADESGRSLLPFGFLAGAAIVELLASVPIASLYFLWTTPAWLVWYLYATRKIGASPRGIRSNASIAD